VTSAARVRVDELVSFALEQLEGLRLPSGLYCFDRAEREPALRGESVRYSLMALLGYQRARDAGLDVRTDLDALFDTCVERVATFTPGDCGLALWAASRQHDRHVPELVRELEQRISAEHALEPLVGMEIAWMVLGLVAVARSEPSSASARRRVVEHFGARRAPSGLYYHDGSSRFRHRLPNFATQIYSLMALCALARAGCTTTRSSTRSRWATTSSRRSSPTQAGPGSSTPSASGSSSASRSTPSTRTPWRRWRCSSSHCSPATCATATPRCAASPGPAVRTRCAPTSSTSKVGSRTGRSGGGRRGTASRSVPRAGGRWRPGGP